MTELNEQQISEISERLARKYAKYWPGPDVGVAIYTVMMECGALYARLSRIEWIGSASVEAEIERFEAEIAAAQSRVIEANKAHPLTERYIQANDVNRPETWEVKHRPAGEGPGEYEAKQRTFFNLAKIGFLKEVFLKKGQPEAGEAQPQELTFEGLFILSSVPALVIQAMQEAEPEPLLNADGEGILFGRANVAPVMALVEILFARKLVREGIAKKAAYKAICSRFGFDLSPRPDKARKEGAGTYQDYKEAFRLFFLNNRPG